MVDLYSKIGFQRNQKGWEFNLKNKKEKKEFKLFDLNKDGKGVYEEENRKPTFLFFFKLFKRKFSQLLRLNLMMLVQIIPVLIILYLYIGGTKTPSATSTLYSALYGISKISAPPSVTADLDMLSIQMGIPIFHPAVVIILICLGVLLAVTWGWINVGASYVCRGMVRGEPVFIWSDFFYAIKKNLKQGFFLGLIDFICIAVLLSDFIFLLQSTGSYFNDVMYFMIIALSIVYFVIRFYIYQLLITFNLSNLKIYKNALIFTVLGIKRNSIALISLVALIAIHLFIIIMFLSIGISVPLVIPIFYAMSLFTFITTYAAYPVIDKYMIAPYASEQKNEEEFEEDMEISE